MTAGGTPPGKAWSGRFTEGADPTAEAFTSSLSFDRRLWLHDIRGSVAWAKAIERAGLIDAAERAVIDKGLEAVGAELESGRFTFRRDSTAAYLLSARWSGIEYFSAPVATDRQPQPVDRHAARVR